MALGLGRRLGHFEVLAPLGAGGMGEVYRARDTRLGRHVALKLLPDSFVDQPQRRARFEREARLLATLNHPGIAAIHESFEDDGVPVIVMELVEGETLDKRLDRGPLSLRQALDLARQIAEALDAAHEKGILHRDLKPSNIKLTPEGRVKLLDFGLAKALAVDSASSSVATLTAPPDEVTDSRVVVGTAPYMSPEQARGEELDKRADVWAFGCVLYEMLTGRRAFPGATRADTIAAVLEREPDYAGLPPSTPPTVRSLLRRSLRKDKAQRLHHIGDARLEIEEALIELSSGVAPAVPGMPATRRFPMSRLWLGGLLLVVTGGLAAWLVLRPFLSAPAAGPANITSLAVLPLQNLSADPKQEYFVDGMTEELITNLARIKSLRVISRTSVMEYKGARKPLPQIAKELKVDALLEGSVLPAADRVRITVQLIYAPTDQHLWAKSYERDLSNIFALQNEVASDITREIKVNLTPRERGHLANAQTVRPDAYQAYLKGVQLMRTPDPTGPDVRMALEMFERAVRLDPDFAVAYAELSRSQSTMYHFQSDRTPERLAKAKAAVEHAFELQPGLPEAHLALGTYYYAGFEDYPKAIREYEVAEKDLPGDTVLLEKLGAARRRMGDFEAALESLKKVHDLSPRDHRIVWETAITCMHLRRYAEADRYYDEAISMAPEVAGYYASKAQDLVLWRGDTKSARAVLERIPTKEDPEAAEGWYHVELFERNYQAALQHARRRRNFFWEGTIHWINKKETLARKSFDQLRVALEEKTKKPDGDSRRSSFNHAFLGAAYAGLGRKEEAIREAKLAVELSPVSRDALRGPLFVWALAYVYTMVGEYDEALNEIDYLLSIPSPFSVSVLRLHPLFDGLRDHPQYQKILEKYGSK